MLSVTNMIRKPQSSYTVLIQPAAPLAQYCTICYRSNNHTHNKIKIDKYLLVWNIWT